MIGATLGLLIGLIFAGPVRAATLEIGPGSDFCAALRDLPPGEDLALQAGDYKGGCAIRRGGRAGAPLTIRAADPQHRPRLVYPGHPVNMLEIRASDIAIRGLDFAGAFGEADGVRIISGDRILIEDCHFSQMGGIAVAATHMSVQGLVVRRNTIVDSHATAMYFGCHDGAGCVISDLTVEGNYIRGVTAPNPEIGYGLELKLNTVGIVRGNVVLDTKGPGIMAYGSSDLLRTSVVERNFIRGSRTSSGLVIGGGPAIVRNNISVGNFEAGIGLENYQRRGLLRAIVVAYNSVYGSRQGGIVVPESEPVQAVIVNNAAHARGGVRGLPEPRPGLRLVGNANCTWAPCFANPEAVDFSPFLGSALLGAAMPWAGSGLATDFFGSARGWPATVGAIEKPGGTIHLGIPAE
jgi:hypothetical protein